MPSNAATQPRILTERERVIETARSYLGVPFRHQGRTRESGIDCAGLLLCVGRELGYLPPEFDVHGYDRTPDGVTLQRVCAEGGRRKSMRNRLPGDLVLMRSIDTSWPTHVGVLSEIKGKPFLIHAWVTAGKVVETSYTDWWQDCTVGLFTFPGMAE